MEQEVFHNKNKRSVMKQSTAVRLLSVMSIAAILSVLALLSFNWKLSNDFDKVKADGETLIENANGFQKASAYLTQEVRSFVASAIHKHYDNYWQEVNVDKNRDKSLEKMREIGLTAEEEEKISEISSISDGLIPLEKKAMELTGQGYKESAVNIVYGKEYQEGVSRIKSITQEFNTLINNRCQAKLDNFGKKIDYSFVSVFISLAILILIQAVIIIYVNRKLLKPVLRVEESMKKMSKGDFEFELDIVMDDTEVGQMASALKEMRDRTNLIIDDIRYLTEKMAEGNLAVKSKYESGYIGVYLPILKSMNALRERQGGAIFSINSAANKVEEESKQLSYGAQSSAEGVAEQVNSIESLFKVIADMTKGIEISAEKISNASDMARENGTAVNVGNEKMEELLAAMKEINDKSKEIFNIIKTIDDIAFQTNILALNAAVEAARAGDAGRGFAVVAGEVGNLAAKSGEAAKDIGELIANSIHAVEKGVKTASETAESLQIVFDNTDKIVKTMKEIEEGSGEQKRGAATVLKGIEQISQVAHETGATSKATAATSEKLSEQAVVLKELVGQFKLT